MKVKNPFKILTKFERILLIASLALITVSYLLSPMKNAITLIASLIGATALIFLARGLIFGQILIIAFASLYAIVSIRFRYYGEMITYLGLSAPAAIAAIISWAKNPYKDSGTVRVARLKGRDIPLIILFVAIITTAFYFILSALGNANIIFSTISVATSALAAALTFLRSPYYALGYASNDIVLIVLWILAAIEDISYLPMILCFVVFLVNDLYGYISWVRMEKLQK